MRTIACRVDLGYTRIAGDTLYHNETMDFEETTPKEVERLVKDGQVNGLILDETGNIVPDILGWNLGNMKIKSGIGNYRNYDEQTEKIGTVYSVVRAIQVDQAVRVYEVISHKCARILLMPKQLLELSKLAWIGGVRVNTETEEILLCDGVKLENWSKSAIFELGSRVISKDKLLDAVKHIEKTNPKTTLDKKDTSKNLKNKK